VDEKMKCTQYFLSTRQRPDRACIEIAWIEFVIQHPEKEIIQQDGRIRRWASIPEADGKYLRVVLLPDGKTVHNAGSAAAATSLRSPLGVLRNTHSSLSSSRPQMC
jgi:hypothetical protein